MVIGTGGNATVIGAGAIKAAGLQAAAGGSGATISPQEAVAQAMAIMSARAQQLTGIEIPKCYNPVAVNPLKYVEQMQKRKLLWSGTKKEEQVPAPSSNQWEQTTFNSDPEGKVAQKFKKLMGIKGEGVEGGPADGSEPDEKIRRQEELFHTLDQQYEMARMSTHTHRGVGLGFGQHPVFPK